MPKDNEKFSIDDALSTSENLAAYVQMLEATDAQLGAALGRHLERLAAGQAVDTSTIWDALYAATTGADASGVA